MQNKKLYITLAVLVVVIAAAAFVGGQLLTGGVNPLGRFSIGGNTMVIRNSEIIPAPELPKTRPDTQGFLVERKDNTVILQTVSMDIGGGGMVASEGGPITSQSGENGPQVEVVFTNNTIIYRDATEYPTPFTGEKVVVQQEVEKVTLDDLVSDTMLMVWGRKNGDRIIADVILYMRPVIRRAP